ncbi:hypothetical protein E2K93_11705 [Thalassotalea sp. HSM 43]|uniref:metallophosphoesterase n=1 Tax=Thalassotalea sp. HSM 43 TaxID=2552945 RepID=UPI0010819D60|nr:metallophosphoesterase [Thalassotalea sp. HSM 43]QBY05008.1 hypothetical protein E2K93_11705 [Thalassotalea sp. HSM 43]
MRINCWLNSRLHDCLKKICVIGLVLLLIACGSDDGSSQADNINTKQLSDGVCDNLGVDPSYAFEPMIYTQPGIHLLVMGDTGTGGEQQKQAAQLFENFHINYPFDAIIHTGDVFYPSGISSSDHPYTDSRFKDIYFTKSYGGLPWYLVAGNHDYDGSIGALKGFFAQHDNLNFANNYYHQRLTQDGVVIDLLALDTDPVIKGAVQAEQISWLADTFATVSKQQSVIIAFGHHPIFSNGSHGNNDALTGIFYDMLKQYQTALYLAGHDHNLEYLVKDNVPQFVISGAAGKTLRDIDCGKHSYYAASKAGGFALYVQRAQIWIIPLTSSSEQIMFKLAL